MDRPKKFCVTFIPKDWPRFTGPAYVDGMSIGEAVRLAGTFRRSHNHLGPTPTLYR